MLFTKHLARLAAIALAALAVVACDPQRINELEEGLSTEVDVRDRFGVPDNVWNEPGGARTLEYNRQPAGQRNYMITIGADGKMSALRQVLTPENFARITPGMEIQEVRRRLGKPAKVTPYALSGETHYDWRFLEPPTTPMVFSIITTDGRSVARTLIIPDMDAPENGRGR
ncbi:MAG: outer membrane protein assembly factor BamE [Burkholderiaceae bacterium]|nr:outer membrane protein assembly factor BamE [Burkholderiaceae bacterium]